MLYGGTKIADELQLQLSAALMWQISVKAVNDCFIRVNDCSIRISQLYKHWQKSGCKGMTTPPSPRNQIFLRVKSN